MYRLIFFLVLAIGIANPIYAQTASTDGIRKIAFTFDDGDTNGYAGHPIQEWNQYILDDLSAHQTKAILYSMGKNKESETGHYVLSSWDSAGHYIANHSWDHKNYSHPNATFQWFKKDFLKNDSLIRAYQNFVPLYRFPYLKEGETREKIDSARAFFSVMGYKNGHVTIDASDWYYNSKLLEMHRNYGFSKIKAFKKLYIEHIYDRALFYDSLSTVLFNRKVSHTLLLHHNLISALFLKDLIQHFKDNGWEIIDPLEALKDPIYDSTPSTIPAGESIIWSLAKERNPNDPNLRYPAEDSRYEEEDLTKFFNTMKE